MANTRGLRWHQGAIMLGISARRTGWRTVLGLFAALGVLTSPVHAKARSTVGKAEVEAMRAAAKELDAMIAT